VVGLPILGTITLPYEYPAGSGIFLRAWNTCNGNPLPSLVWDRPPADTAAALWAQTIAQIPLPDIELTGTDRPGRTVVNTDTWMYAGPNATPFTVTGGFANNLVTITVAPVAMRVDWGDGTIQECGLGIAYNTVKHPRTLLDPDPGPPDACTHVYRKHSGNQPKKKYPINATLTWNATWSTTTGQGGTFEPYNHTTNLALQVIQIQTINSPNPHA
jgi:hypothetical protein